jgi:hypothetical protein
LETIEIGENTRVIIGPDKIVIRRGWTNHVFSLTQFLIFAVFAIAFSYFTIQFSDGVRSVKGITAACCFLGMALLGFISLFTVKEIDIDLNHQTLRRCLKIFNVKVRNNVLYRGISDVNYGWMSGHIGDLDNKTIKGYELVAYKNKQVHKDLLFFKEKATTENLGEIFREKLNLEIHDRLRSNKI